MKIRDTFYQVLFLIIIISLSRFTNLFAQIKVDSLIKVPISKMRILFGHQMATK